MGGISVSGGVSPSAIDIGRFDNALAPTGTVAETFPRQYHGASLAIGATGVLFLSAIYLPVGTTVTNITYVSAGTGAGTPTNQWFALYSSARAKLEVTADDTTTAWASNTAKTLALASPYTTTSSGLYYVGICVVAATVPTVNGKTVGTAGVHAIAPILSGTSSTGLTDPASAPATAGAITATTGLPYVYLT